MYCTLDEAWPDIVSIKQNNNQHFKHTQNNNIHEHFKESQLKYNDNHLTTQNCKNILFHIQNCDVCIKEIYKKYMCMNAKYYNPFNNLITKENKEIISVVLIGLLVILVLQLLKN